ncbi:MAG: hypothetical protein AAFV72_08025 [Cyanobacteria bacterium J06635_1]
MRSGRLSACRHRSLEIAQHESNCLRRRQLTARYPTSYRHSGAFAIRTHQPPGRPAQVSRKFIYQQGQKAQQALDESFAPNQADEDVLFYLPVTKNWLFQLILGLILICHSSYRGVEELFCDLFDLSISIGTIHNRLQATAVTTAEINQSQGLSGIEVGLHDEIFQAAHPVLVGVDAASTYCYRLQGVERRDEDTWGWYLLEVMNQGFAPDYTIADGGSALPAGQKAVMSETPCHGDVFHIQQQFEQVANGLT